MATRREELVITGIRQLLNGTARVAPRSAGKIGYRLLCRPRRPAPTPDSMPFLELAEQKKITLAGIPTQTYFWPGKGPGVLLLHGWESCTSRWYEFYEFLRKAGFAIYAFDAPAHGRSGGDNFTVIEYANVLTEYLLQLEKPPVHWIGHSGGGMAIMFYLSQTDYKIAPERVVAMSVPGELTDFLDIFKKVVGVKDKVIANIEREFTRRMKLRFKDVSPRRYAKDIKVPGLIIHDIDDELAPIEGAEDIYENWENACFITTEGLGHSIPGEEVVALVTEYLLLEEAEL